MKLHHLAMVPSPQQTFSGQGVLRISGFFLFCKYFFLSLLFIIILLSGDVEQNPGPSSPKFCNILCSNIRGLHGNLNELSLLSSKYDIICCSETLVSDRRHLSELQIPNFKKPLLLLRNSRPRAQGLCIYTKVGYNAFRFNKFECDCHEFMIVRVCSRFNNLYI